MAEPVSYEFKKKSSVLNMRIPQSLLEAIKTKTRQKGVPFTHYVRTLIERDIARS
ncbi:CopG family antitoxin [Pseudochelatococcus sp. B33]